MPKKYPYLRERQTPKGPRFSARFSVNGEELEHPLDPTFTKEQAAIAAVQIRQDFLDGKIRKNIKLTFGEAAKRFLQDRWGYYPDPQDPNKLVWDKALSKGSKKTAQGYKSCINMLMPVFGDVRMADINKQVLHTYVQARRLHESPQGGFITNRTVRYDLQTLSAIFTFLVNTTDEFTANPLLGFDRSAIPLGPHRTRFLELDEMDTLLNASRQCVNEDMHDLILMSFLLGLRRNETYLCSRDHLERDRDGRYQFNLPASICKGKSGRAVPVPSEFEPTLKRLLDKPSCPSGGNYLFWSKRTKTHYVDLKDAWTATKQTAGIDDFRWHDLRHCFATHRLRRGMSIAYLSKIMGHSDISITMKYANHATQDLHDAISAVPIDIAVNY